MADKSKDRGWEYLTSDGEDFDFDPNNDGSWGSQDDDGSGSYYGADGSWGSKDSDGSASYYGADGSWGSKDADGSGSYYGADGSWGSIDSDGSWTYYGADGSFNCGSSDEKFDPSNDEDDSCSSGASAAAYARYEREQQEEAERRIQQERARERRRARFAFYKKHWKGILIGFVVLALGLFIAYEVYEYQKSIEVGYSSEEFIGQDITTAEKMLRRSGFTNIKKEAVKDIDISEVELENTVKLVRIKKKTEFSKDKKFPYDTQVVVQYHVVPKIKIPISSREAKKMKMSKLKEALEEAGFVNVKAKADYDLIKGWISKKEDVENISIDGDKKFKEGEKYRPDAEIIIKYHAFKKDKKK